MLAGVPFFYYFMNSPMTSKAKTHAWHQTDQTHPKSIDIWGKVEELKRNHEKPKCCTKNVTSSMQLDGNWQASTLLSTAIAFGMTMTLLQTVGLVGIVKMKWPPYIEPLMDFASWPDRMVAEGRRSCPRYG